MTRDLRLAGFFTRAVAFAVDGEVINGAALVFGAGIAFALSLFGISVSSISLRAALGAGAWLLAVAVYFAAFWTLTGQTPGMRVMGLRVIAPDGRLPSRSVAARRLLGIALCVLTFGVGFLLVLVDDQRRGLHDLVAGTLVVHGDVLPAPAVESEPRPAGAEAPSRPQPLMPAVTRSGTG